MVRKVSYVPGSTQKLYQLTGDKDKERNTPTISQTECIFHLKGTDLGSSFEHNGRIYFLFGDSVASDSSPYRPVSGDSIAWTPTDTDPENGIQLQFVTAPDDGYYLSPKIECVEPPITLGSLEVPMAGFSANDKMYVFFTTDYNQHGNGLMGRSVLAWSEDGAKTPFHYLGDLSILDQGGKFINVSVVIVDSPAIPGMPNTSGKSLLLWGSGPYRKSNPYLAYLPLDSLEAQPKSCDPHFLTGLQYFAGVEEGSLQPRWSTRESDAIALFEHPVIGELSVTWNPFLELWLMLYNEDRQGTDFVNHPSVINFRVAEKPWGPWSPTALLFHPWKDHGYCHFVHAADRNCDQISDPGHESDWGEVYAPYVISPYTRGDRTHTTIYFVMSTWNPYNTVLMKSTLKLEYPLSVITGTSHTDFSGNPVLIQSRFGTAGNFEVVVPLTGGGLAHFWRNNDLPHLDFPWSNPTLFATNTEQFDAISFIQSTPGNFEVVARAGDRLVSFRRDATSPFSWAGPDPVEAVNFVFGSLKDPSIRVETVTGVAGTPALIQSRFGSVENFELLVPLAGGGLAHYERSNDNPIWHGPIVLLEPQTHFEAVSFIQSTPGNFEVVARAGDRLVTFRRDATSPFSWHGPSPLIADGQPITHITGNPVLIQSHTGNFELVVPLTNAGFAHYWRDNESPDHLWHGPTIVQTLNQFKAVSVIESNLGTPGNLEVVSLKNHLRPTALGSFSPTSDQLAHSRQDFIKPGPFRPEFHWSGPFDFTSS